MCRVDESHCLNHPSQALHKHTRNISTTTHINRTPSYNNYREYVESKYNNSNSVVVVEQWKRYLWRHEVFKTLPALSTHYIVIEEWIFVANICGIRTCTSSEHFRCWCSRTKFSLVLALALQVGHRSRIPRIVNSAPPQIHSCIPSFWLSQNFIKLVTPHPLFVYFLHALSFMSRSFPSKLPITFLYELIIRTKISSLGSVIIQSLLVPSFHLRTVVIDRHNSTILSATAIQLRNPPPSTERWLLHQEKLYSRHSSWLWCWCMEKKMLYLH